MTCYELRITLPDESKDLLTALLFELGETNFVEGALDCDVEFDFDYEHFQRDYYGELGHNLPVILYGEDKAHLEKVRSTLIEKSGSHGLSLTEQSFTLVPIKDQNWRESWKASFKPVDIDGICCILPPWEDPKAFPQKYKIVIDPGMAFGTGQHETTKLCLKIYYQLENSGHHFNRVYDVGTGSGILAIATKMHGATRVVGCDIDDKSVEIARENANMNSTEGIEFTTVTVADMKELDFDLVFANIQSRPLVKIFGDILLRTAKNGKIIISGILATEMKDFGAFLERSGVEIERVEQLGDWVGILCKPATK